MKEGKMKKVISTDLAPKAIGPYSQAISANGFLFISGQGAIDPASNVYKPMSIDDETDQALKNLKAILESAGSNLNQVVKTTVFLKDMKDFPLMNEVYKKYFQENSPARSAIEASNLPKGFKVEIEAIALIGS
jgi:2-iminobutanoate/2-iminopropanoate deaminase